MIPLLRKQILTINTISCIDNAGVLYLSVIVVVKIQKHELTAGMGVNSITGQVCKPVFKS